MTAVLPEPQTSPTPHRARATPAPALTPKSFLQRFKPLLYWRWIQTLLLLGIATTLYYDRYNLCQQYLFKYTDEDQVLMWSAAHDLISGHIYEPCFYGQDYNSCIEGYLAVPLILAHVPYHIAVPLVTVFLGLLPYLALAYVAWRRGLSLVSAICLLIPIVLPSRYGIITGIPRGFVTGLAFAIFPALLLLPPPPRPRRATTFGEEPKLVENRKPRWLRRSWPMFRYFFAPLIACFAAQLNPSCALLLGPVAVFAVLTTWREWKFWVYGLAGLFAGLPILIYAYQFYHVYHTDYVWYLRDKVYTWSMENYKDFLWTKVAPAGRPSVILSDLVPIHLAGTAAATTAVIVAFSVLALLLVLRLRMAAVAALFAGAMLTFLSFAYDRVDDGRVGNYAAFSYTRMYLAIPVVFVWLVFLLSSRPWPRFSNIPLTRWLTRGALVGCLIAGIVAMKEKAAGLQRVMDYERGSGTCTPRPVDNLYALAHEVQRCADATKADIVIVNDKVMGYSLAALTNCETMIPNVSERRAWRLVQENGAHRHDKMLLIELQEGTPIGGGSLRVDIDGNRVDTPNYPINQPGRSIRQEIPAESPNLLQRLFGGNGATPQTPAPRPATRTSDPSPAAPIARAPVKPSTPTRTIYLPTITVASTNGHSVNLALSVLGINIPRIYTPAPTRENPHPGPMVTRQSWRR